MKVFLAQINTIVGDIEGNSAKILEALGKGRELRADLAVFPELTITGYPPRDLLDNHSFIADSLRALDKIADAAQGIAAIVGLPMRNESGSGNGLYNTAALCAEGRISHRFAKCLLPTYDVFDEDRHFEPGPEARIAVVRGTQIGVSICEDAWNDPEFWGRRFYDRDPIGEQAAQGADFLVNISASPFALGRPAVRERLLGGHAARHRRPLVCVNLVGGNDEILFDGRSCIFDAEGRRVASLAAFQEDYLLFDLQTLPGPAPAQVSTGLPIGADPARSGFGTAAAGSPPPALRENRSNAAEAFDALVMGLHDYVAKCGFSRVVLGLSGGIDSSVVAAIAAAALGRDAVTGVSMPSRYSSKGSRDDAAALATNLAIDMKTIPIERVFSAYLDTLGPAFEGSAPGVAEENIQARVRGNILMALSNRFGWMVLTTGNKSEMAVGYTTLYGDMSGGLAAISDVPKTLVYEIARYINREREIIPAPVFTKPPSAELRPNQTDQDTLPPYAVLDAILHLYIEKTCAVKEIVASGYDETIVREIVRRVNRSEYKRKQAPPGLRITTKAFGSGRRMPIAQRYVEP